MTLIIDLWNSAALLAALGGLVAALRVAANTPGGVLREKVWNVAAAVVLAMGLAEYLTPVDMPRISLVVGLVAGGVCDSVLDAVRALSPKAATSVAESWLARFGYTKKPDDDPPS